MESQNHNLKTWLEDYFSVSEFDCLDVKVWDHSVKNLAVNDFRNNQTDKTNKMRVRPVWSESSLCAQWVAKDPSFLHANSENSDQTEQMPRLIQVFAGTHSLRWFCHVLAHFWTYSAWNSAWFSDMLKFKCQRKGMQEKESVMSNANWKFSHSE